MAASDEQRRAAIARDLGDARDAPVRVVEHDPSWAQQFALEADRLRALVPHLRPQHIGSTAVEGMAAKPIIDLMALVEDLDKPIATLTGAGGYAFPVAYNATLEHRRWLCRPGATVRTHHLHLVDDAALLDRHLRFRDLLRTDGALAYHYAALKRGLAAEHSDDRDAYTQAKRAFVDNALSQAR